MQSPALERIEGLVADGKAYVRDGHVLCWANAAPATAFDYACPRHLKVNESDVLLWKPHTILGLRADRCVQSAWGPGHPTCNASLPY